MAETSQGAWSLCEFELSTVRLFVLRHCSGSLALSLIFKWSRLLYARPEPPYGPGEGMLQICVDCQIAWRYLQGDVVYAVQFLRLEPAEQFSNKTAATGDSVALTSKNSDFAPSSIAAETEIVVAGTTDEDFNAFAVKQEEACDATGLMRGKGFCHLASGEVLHWIVEQAGRPVDKASLIFFASRREPQPFDKYSALLRTCARVGASFERPTCISNEKHDSVMNSDRGCPGGNAVLSSCRLAGPGRA